MSVDPAGPAEPFSLPLHRLRAEPTEPSESRTDLGGDHAFDPGLTFLHESPPRAAAVLVPVIDHPGAPTVLLTERATGLRAHSGQIAFPGGRVDLEDTSTVAAALREAEEEIGLDRAHVTPLGFLDSYLSSSNYLIVPVVARVRPGFSLRLNPQEVARVFEVPLAFLMDEANHELHAREWQGGIRTYYAMPFGAHYIWGVTAGILRNMFERLYGP